ncbi:MarR family winged helix-turn-helix transcriptional regulator [uncultured Methanobrevibacter sp.]|uniref:MarR family winged helix-turn-helix transcriptional regulator n=1 Tax=uncultured Methanobrevibacter sp. TaxID=253161 RepID=UPI0025E31CA8|nr:MarR family transcriptional regulator [uncultured Methanobrevibacter sp.]
MTIEKTKIPEHLNYLLNLTKSYEAYFKKNMDTTDINIGEILILLEIYNNEGLNQIDIVKKFHVTEANISKTTKNLLVKGLIIKKIDVENNTKKLLFLTDKGQEACEKLLGIFKNWNEEVIKDIPMDELIKFSEILSRLSENSIQLI